MVPPEPFEAEHDLRRAFGGPGMLMGSIQHQGELTEAYVRTLGTECKAELMIAEQMKVDPSVSTDRKVEQMGKVRVARGGWYISKRAAASMLQHRIIGI